MSKKPVYKVLCGYDHNPQPTKLVAGPVMRFGDECRVTRTCPFCGAEFSVAPCINTICGCGGKYYAKTQEWYSRVTREVVKEGEKG